MNFIIPIIVDYLKLKVLFILHHFFSLTNISDLNLYYYQSQAHLNQNT